MDGPSQELLAQNAGRQPRRPAYPSVGQNASGIASASRSVVYVLLASLCATSRPNKKTALFALSNRTPQVVQVSTDGFIDRLFRSTSTATASTRPPTSSAPSSTTSASSGSAASWPNNSATPIYRHRPPRPPGPTARLGSELPEPTFQAAATRYGERVGDRFRVTGSKSSTTIGSVR